MREHETPALAVGQRWADCDKRLAGTREVVIETIYVDYAMVRVWINGKRTNRCTRISLSRFRPTATGYRYVGMEATTDAAE